MPNAKQEVDYSLVIPCYNEAKGLPELVAKCQPLLSRRDVEVVIVNNGSTDDSKDVIGRLLETTRGNLRSVTVNTNQGYGHGILAGLRSAKGSVLGWTHADLQTEPGDFLKAIQFFNTATDKIFVKGHRVQRPLSDNIFTVGMSLFESILLMTRLSDINAQPTVFTKEFFKSWKNPPQDFSLDLFAFYLSRKQGLEVKRFDVVFGERKYGTSRWNINWSAKQKFIARTIRYSLSLRKAKPWK